MLREERPKHHQGVDFFREDQLNVERTSLTSEDLEFLKFNWKVAIEKNLSFLPGTAWFSSDFFAELRGKSSHTTIDAVFEQLGLTPLKDKEGKAIKDRQFFFWNLLEVRKL